VIIIAGQSLIIKPRKQHQQPNVTENETR